MSKGAEIAQKSLIISLNPYLDEKGILRMNGRVNNSELQDQKIAIILPAQDKFTELLIHEVHKYESLHGGLQLTLRTTFLDCSRT